MAPRQRVLAPSESKVRFFQRLGLDEHDEAHRRIYNMMKDEAVEGRKRITASKDVLIPSLRGDASVEPPYSNAQISESAIHREVLRIYSTARPETRAIYELGRMTEGIVEENWIIRWMLWHVFRYRDSRNRNRGSSSSSETPAVQQNLGQAKFLDLGTVPLITDEFEPISPLSDQPTASVLPRSNGYWDPVRDL